MSVIIEGNHDLTHQTHQTQYPLGPTQGVRASPSAEVLWVCRSVLVLGGSLLCGAPATWHWLLQYTLPVSPLWVGLMLFFSCSWESNLLFEEAMYFLGLCFSGVSPSLATTAGRLCLEDFSLTTGAQLGVILVLVESDSHPL